MTIYISKYRGIQCILMYFIVFVIYQNGLRQQLKEMILNFSRILYIISDDSLTLIIYKRKHMLVLNVSLHLDQ